METAATREWPAQSTTIGKMHGRVPKVLGDNVEVMVNKFKYNLDR